MSRDFRTWVRFPSSPPKSLGHLIRDALGFLIEGYIIEPTHLLANAGNVREKKQWDSNKYGARLGSDSHHMRCPGLFDRDYTIEATHLLANAGTCAKGNNRCAHTKAHVEVQIPIISSNKSKRYLCSVILMEKFILNDFFLDRSIFL